jgi:putative ABC transport system permease protein
VNGGVTVLSGWDLLVATVLILVAVSISLALRLGVARQLLLAAVRCVVQLGLIGLVLEKVFALDLWLLVAGLVAAMTFFAAREASARSTHRYRGILLDAWIAIASSSLLVGAVVTQVVVGVEPWYDPQYVIPLVGMILGNSLTGIALCLDRVLDHAATRRSEIELRLSYGATRAEAMNAALRESVRTGLVPIVNAMSAAGLVSLPGMMTGQILAGSPPMQAVAYQVVVMFMIAAAVAIGAMVAALLAGRQVITRDGMLALPDG